MLSILLYSLLPFHAVVSKTCMGQLLLFPIALAGSMPHAEAATWRMFLRWLAGKRRGCVVKWKAQKSFSACQIHPASRGFVACCPRVTSCLDLAELFQYSCYIFYLCSHDICLSVFYFLDLCVVDKQKFQQLSYGHKLPDFCSDL